MSALLPLRALQVLETVSRHGSFAKAASELHLTQSAVSHQVRTLEARLGTKLFSREHKKLVLTPAGQRLAFVMSLSLAQISEAMSSVQGARDREGVTLSVLPSFASNWLMPRLHRFTQRHPDIDVHIASSQNLSDPGRDGTDVAIRYGNGRWRGLHATHLLSESVFPVCAPNFNRGRLPRTLQELVATPLIADLFHPWKAWLREAGLKSTGNIRCSTYTDSGLLLQAAERGLGVALGRKVLAEEALATGRLIRPLEAEVRSPLRYYVVYAGGSSLRPAVEKFVDWLRSEAAEADRGEI